MGYYLYCSYSLGIFLGVLALGRTGSILQYPGARGFSTAPHAIARDGIRAGSGEGAVGVTRGGSELFASLVHSVINIAAVTVPFLSHCCSQ